MMFDLILFFLAATAASVMCTVCHLAVCARLVREAGIVKGLTGVVFFPYAYAWGWRHRAIIPKRMAAWTCAALSVAILAALELQMVGWH